MLTKLCHEVDLPRLLDLFAQARSKAEQRFVVGPTTIRLRRADGGYRPFGVFAIGWLEPATSHHVLCKFTAPDGRPTR